MIVRSNHAAVRFFRFGVLGLFEEAFLLSRGSLPMRVRTNEEWVEEQFSACQLGNALRTKRLRQVATNMLNGPEQSLPQQNLEWADLKAAYRLFQQAAVTFDAVSAVHWQQTRATKPGRYLLISDTTDLDHTSHRATKGLSFLGGGLGRGMQLHSCLVYDCDHQLVTGTAGALLHYRRATPKQETRMQRLKRQRESQLWGQLVAQVGPPPAGAHWIHVFDRGGDHFEAFCHLRQTQCDWIVRAAKLNRNVRGENGEKMSLKQALRQTTLLGTYELALRSRPGMRARTAVVEVSVVHITFPRPRHCSPWLRRCGIHEMPMSVVLVREKNPPRGASRIQWVLLNSQTITTFEQAYQAIDDYEHRWLIEEYHKVLKTGCSIERHALQTADRLEPLVGLIAVVGTRLLQLKLLGRSQPELKAATCVPANWLKVLKRKRPKLEIPTMTVYVFFRELAKLGGFLGRKHDGEPGWQTIWRGYQKLLSLIEGFHLAEAS